MQVANMRKVKTQEGSPKPPTNVGGGYPAHVAPVYPGKHEHTPNKHNPWPLHMSLLLQVLPSFNTRPVRHIPQQIALPEGR